MLDRSTDSHLDTIGLKELLYTPNWQSRELTRIQDPKHRLYREEQLESKGQHPYASPHQIKAYLTTMLEHYLYIDEVQEW